MINLSMNITLLVSIMNTYLRSKYSSLEILCDKEDIDYLELLTKLEANDYYFDENQNQIKCLTTKSSTRWKRLNYFSW